MPPRTPEPTHPRPVTPADPRKALKMETLHRLTSRPWVVLAVAAAVTLAGLILVTSLTTTTSDLSCEEITAEILDMTGPNATEDYDADRVRELNEARANKGCEVGA